MIPSALFMGAILVYPMVSTFRFSFMDAKAESAVGLDNYRWAIESDAVRSVLVNSGLWIVLLPLLTTLIGLSAAVLTDRVRYERISRSILILPTAVSLVAASVMWQMMYRYQPPGVPQTGTINAVTVNLFAMEPVTWLVNATTARFALIVIGVWIYSGLATLILSAALKNVPGDVIDAARVDGASEWQTFRHITLRMLLPTIGVVVTTIVAMALKMFDIVFVLTNGRFGTDVIANRVFSELFTSLNIGRGSALAVILFLGAVPIMVINVWRVRRGSDLSI
jgi:alpha-glucoside transport system permease protein